LIPAVYRNGRYERRLDFAEIQIAQLAANLTHAFQMIETLTRAINPENHIPALPETPREFGRGH
jgi:hypothetical protein